MSLSVSCSAHTSPNTAPGDKFGHVSQENLVDLLDDSFAEAGGKGFFVDNAWHDENPPFSLHETYWQLRWAGASPQLDISRAAPWIRSGTVGRLNTSSLQPLAQIAYATWIASTFGIEIDRDAVEAAVEAFRDGAKYSSVSGQPGDWGSTIVALRIREVLALGLPDGVADAARTELLALPPRLDASEVVTSIAPLLSVVAIVNRGDPQAMDSARVAAQLARTALQSVQSSDVDGAWLGGDHELAAATSALGMPVVSLDPAVCRHLLNDVGYVSSPGTTNASTQLTYLARERGCVTASAPPSWPKTRAGWVDPWYFDPHESLATSVAAMRAAQALGIEGRYARQIGQSIIDVWLPLLSSSDSADEALLAHVRLLDAAQAASAEGVVPALELSDLADPGLALLLRMIAGQFLPAEERRQLAQMVGPAIGPILSSQPSLDMVTSVGLMGRLSGNSELLDRARAELERFRVGPGTFASTPCADDPTACQPSFVASVVGAWLMGAEDAPRAQWASSGLCSGYACRGAGDDDATHRYPIELRSIAAALLCDLPGCGYMFPYGP